VVKSQNPVYLLIGQDSLSKDVKIKGIKEEFLSSDTADFNLDVLYGPDLNLKGLQEKLLSLPLKATRRIVIIRQADELKPQIKDFLSAYVKKPYPSVLLIVDIERFSPKDSFAAGIAPYAQVSRFKESGRLDAFMLGRQIDAGRPGYALATLHQLLSNGEKPERILGGLRHAVEAARVSGPQARRRLKALLVCDTDIKTGKLRPDFALERLVVKLCASVKRF